MFDDAFEKCWYVTRNGDDTLKKVEQIRSDALDKRTERVPSSVELAVVWEKDYDQATESSESLKTESDTVPNPF